MALWELETILKPELIYNIWTIRLTPKIDDETKIVKMLSSLPPKKFPKILCYKENVNKSGRLHYHIRICADGTWSTRKSLFDFVRKHFPDEGGNKLFSTKKVHVLGIPFSSYIKSAPYCAKECGRVYTRGYDIETLGILEMIGSSWKSIKNLPQYKKIIQLYNINESSTGKMVSQHIIEYYDKENKDPPSFNQLKRIMFLIKYNVSQAFRTDYHLHAYTAYDNNLFFN